MTLFDEAVQLTNRLTLVEKLQLLEHLSTSLKHDVEIEAYKNIPWGQFLELTYGSLADDPIERHQPEHTDVRDEIE